MQPMWVIPWSKATQLVTDVITKSYGFSNSSVPPMEFWPELGASEEANGSVYAAGVYESHGPFGTTITMGGSVPLINHVLHEVGHHLEGELFQFNTSGKLGGELVADMFAVGYMQKLGIPTTAEAVGYAENESAYGVAMMRCGGSLANCGAFWNALVEGDEAFFSERDLIPFLSPKGLGDLLDYKMP